MRVHFPIYRTYPDLIYLDNASTVHKPLEVMDAMNHYISHDYSNIHRGQYFLAEQSEQLYIQTKKTVAQFIGWDYREIIYTYNATHASNIIAQSVVYTYKLHQGDVVLVGIWDHHATIVPWQLLSQQFWFEVQFIDINPETLEVDWDKFQEQINNKNVKVVACSHVSNVTGKIYDIKKIWQKLSDNVFFVVDGAQAVPHFQIDVSTLWADAYFFTGHKMMGPTGIGVLWITKEQARLLKTTYWWGWIIEDVTIQWSQLIRTADKFEPWTPNLIGAVGLAAACDFYHKHDVYEYIKQEHSVWKKQYDVIISILGPQAIIGGIDETSIGIISLSVLNYQELWDKFTDHNVCVRIGAHCAHPLLSRLDMKHGVIRISPFVYNTWEDLERLIELL